MRTGGDLFHSTTQAVSRMTTAEATTTAKATFTPPATVQRSPWHSPVPYLFGGLAAMLGLIAFALLILACSYWKLSGTDDGAAEGPDVESGAEKGDNSSDAKTPAVFEEKFLVIMAGEVNPTFLATPASSRTSSFNDEKIDNKLERVNEENVKQKFETANEDQNGDEEDDDDADQLSQLSRDHN